MSVTADRYAKALFDLSREANSQQQQQEALDQIGGLIRHSADFRAFLSNPLLSYEESTAVLKALFESRVPALVLRFLIFIAYKGRLNLLGEMIESFDNMYLAETRQMRAFVKTAMPISDDEKAFISQRLQDKFHQKVTCGFGVDTSLIGGFRIFAQGKLYDYSFRGQLQVFLQQTT